MKKVEPKTWPAKENSSWLYSNACTKVKQAPSRTVRIRPHFKPLRSPSSSAWCAQVTVVPEVRRISVLRSGRCHGSKVSMPFGGQTQPNRKTTPENSATKKKAQNHATKNNTSEAMNRIMP